MSASVERERAQGLMMAAVDGEISPDERSELDRMLDQDPELRREWERMGRVKEVTRTMTYRKPPDEVWGRYWTSVYNRFERGIGWILASIGAVVLLGYGAWSGVEALFEDSSVPLFLRLAILAVAVGLAVLAVSVIREKLFTRRHDPYKEVER